MVINRDEGKCRFCSFRFNKYLFVDHLNEDASNNSLSNLRINCKWCDRFRHCGLAGVNGELVLRFSDMKQIDIVKKSYQFYSENNRNPRLEDIDPSSSKIYHF